MYVGDWFRRMGFVARLHLLGGESLESTGLEPYPTIKLSERGTGNRLGVVEWIR